MTPQSLATFFWPAQRRYTDEAANAKPGSPLFGKPALVKPGQKPDKVVGKELTMMGAFGVDWRSYETAVRIVESGKYPLAKMHTHTLPLDEAERGLELLAGRVAGADAIHIALVP